MNSESMLLLLKAFLVDHEETFQLHKKDINKWLIEYYDGIPPAHTQFYEIKNLLLSYMIRTRHEIYEIDKPKLLIFVNKLEKKGVGINGSKKM